MNNEEQLKRLKELSKKKNKILRKIGEENVNLLTTESNLESLLESLRDINTEQKKIWKARHKVRRLKYDQSDRAKELSRIRSNRNNKKKKEAKLRKSHTNSTN